MTTIFKIYKKSCLLFPEALAKVQVKKDETKPIVVDLDKNGEVRNNGKSDNLAKTPTTTTTSEEKVDEKKADQIKDKSKPISSTPVAGTPWFVLMYCL